MKQIDKWYMTDDEIRRSWRMARDPKEQIGIIAELNARSKDDVIQKLRELGEDVPELKSRKARYKITEADLRKIWKSRMEGLPYWKIARMLGGIVTETTIKNRYCIMKQEYQEALPTVKKALQTFVEAVPTADAVVIKSFIRRFL